MKARSFALVVTLTALVGTAGLAWACTAAPATNTLSTQLGAPGSTVMVTATNFAGTTSPVEIRWNSISGPLLATATGPDFNVPITVPADATPGIYYVVALAHSPAGGFAAKVSQTFEVVAPSSATAPATGSLAENASAFADESVPGLVDDSPVPTSGRSSGTSAGVALLAVGLVALFSAFAAMEVGRRRRLASRVEK